MEKINALIEKLQELKNSNAGLQTISYYVQLLQAEVLHTRNAQLQQKNTQTNIAVIMPSDRMAAHNTLPAATEVPAPVAQTTSAVPPVAENVPAPAPVPENIPAPAAEVPAAEAPAATAPPANNHLPAAEAKPVILHIPKLVAAYTPPVVKHPPPPAPETPAHTAPATAPAAATPTPAPTPAQVPPAQEHVPAATYTPPAATTPAANHTSPPVPPVMPPAPPVEAPAVAAAAKPVPAVPKPAPATLFDTTTKPAPAHHHNNGHRQEQHAENHSIRKELNELVGQSQSGTSLNERLRTGNVEVAEKLRELGIKDLRDAIGINDKFQFIQELFRGDRDMYDRSVKTINECTSLQEAEYWIQRELKIYQGWQDDDTLVKHFYSLVKKRFS